MDTTTTMQITEGTDVYGSDGDKVGSVVAVQPSYVVVEKGFFFPTDYYIPTSAIANAADDGLYLNVTKDAALNQGWDVEPAADAVAATGTGTVGRSTTVTTDVDDYDAPPSYVASGGGYAADMGSETIDVDRGDTTATGRGQVGSQPFEHDAAPDSVGHVHGEDAIRVPVHEEELTATKRQREVGEVRIEKDVIAEEKVLEVPVTEERVRVERHAVDRPVGADETAFEEGVIEVPVMGEEVTLQKDVRVAEEVEIDKEAVQRTERVAGTVRREEVHVEDASVDVAAGEKKRKR